MRTGDAFCPICAYPLGNVLDKEGSEDAKTEAVLQGKVNLSKLPRVCPRCEWPIGADVDSKEAMDWRKHHPRGTVVDTNRLKEAT